MMQQRDIIRIACWRTPNYSETASADLATAIVRPVALQPCTLLELFQDVQTHGGDTAVAEAGKLFKYDGYIDRIELSLASGLYASVFALLTIGRVLEPMSNATVAALNGALAARVLRLVDVVASEHLDPEMNEIITIPASITAADVDEALDR